MNSTESLLCCLKAVTCFKASTSKTPVVCKRLFESTMFVVAAWIITFAMLLMNSFVFYSAAQKLKQPRQQYSKKDSIAQTYQTMLLESVISQFFFYCFALLIFSATDVQFGTLFNLVQFKWQQNFFCFIQFFSFTWSTLSVLVSMNLLSYSNHSVIYHPIKSKFLDIKIVVSALIWQHCITFAVSLGLSAVVFVSSDTRIPCNLCIPLNTGLSSPLCMLMGHVSASSFAFYCVTTSTLNFSVIYKLKGFDKHHLLHHQIQKTKQKAVVKCVKTTILNLFVWIPALVLSLLVNLTTESSKQMVVFLTVVLIPHNSFPLLLYCI